MMKSLIILAGLALSIPLWAAQPTRIRDGILQTDLNADSNRITNLAAPTISLDAANKAYVDSLLNPPVAISDDITLLTHPSALLHLKSTTRGFLMPRMTTAQRNAISSPAVGLLVVNLDTITIDAYNGSSWVSVAAGTSSSLLDGIGSTRGSILYRGASGWAIAAPGTAGYVWTANGTGADPTYQAPAAGGFTVTNYTRMPWTTLTLSNTNVSTIDFNAASMFKLVLTNNAFISAPSNLPGTNSAQVIQLHVAEDGTGGYSLTMTNSAWVLAGSGTATNAVVSLTTNANAVTILTFVTSPFSATKIYAISAATGP